MHTRLVNKETPAVAMFRRKADRVIDDAHICIANAEAMLLHSYTDEQVHAAQDELTQAQRYLARAVAAREAWDAAPEPHDEYEDYPDVPRDVQGALF